jgi:hypothetical protein
MDNATNRWLDALSDDDKSDGHSGSDYRLSQLLGIERQMVSKYRHGIQHLSDDVAVRLAQLLDVPEILVVAEIRRDRTRDPKTRSFWADLAAGRRAAKVVAGVAVMMTALGLGLPSPAEAKAGVSVPAYSTIYTMRTLADAARAERLSTARRQRARKQR